ncbi:MAG: hypothetical protein WD800_05545 [Dehalococcoidia bacterium]
MDIIAKIKELLPGKSGRDQKAQDREDAQKRGQDAMDSMNR